MKNLPEAIAFGLKVNETRRVKPQLSQFANEHRVLSDE